MDADFEYRPRPRPALQESDQFGELAGMLDGPPVDRSPGELGWRLELEGIDATRERHLRPPVYSAGGMPKKEIEQRGGAVRVRTIKLSGGRYANVYVVRRKGPKGGRTVIGEPIRKKGVAGGTHKRGT